LGSGVRKECELRGKEGIICIVKKLSGGVGLRGGNANNDKEKTGMLEKQVLLKAADKTWGEGRKKNQSA